MAEAYASLVSLMHIIDQIMDHGRDSFSLNHQQVESLQERVAYLVDILERYTHGDNKDDESLESQIADASHAAEAYESLVPLMHIIEKIMHHGRDSFSLNHEQIESLQERAAYLVDFLERYSHGDNKDDEGLASQIADASHAAEDLIESRVVDYIHDNQSTSFTGTSSNTFCQQLQEVIEVMDLMKDKAMELKGKGEPKVHLPRDSRPSSSSSSLPASKDTMVGFDDVLIQIMDKLTRQQSNFQIIPIHGMGGIGKTTLARNVYENPCIVQHFDNRAWITISQEYEIKEIISSLLIEFNVFTKETIRGMNESQLREQLHKFLFNRKYLIVMDDMWSIDVWDKVQSFFLNNGNGSGIMITTRLTLMARQLGSNGLEVNFLDEDQSWNLLRQRIFGQQECSIELEEIGKKIATKCKGLPLSIVVIAGILASNMTREEWVRVAKEVNSIASLADDGQCSKILSWSYKNLPVHLKPCFLYMGTFPEDDEIKVSRLIKLWVAEGFLKPNKDKSLEAVAEEYLIDLIDRNLVMVHKHKFGEIKTVKIHDLLGDICLREAEKEKFICVIGEKGSDSSHALYNHRRIVIDGRKKQQKDSAYSKNQGAVSNISSTVVMKEKKSKRILRSITFNNVLDFSYSSLLDCGLIRVLNGDQPDLLKIAFNLVNLRYLNILHEFGATPLSLPSTLELLWNLQTLIIRNAFAGFTTPPEIWKMKQLRHLYLVPVYLPIYLPIVLKHLHTLPGIANLTSCDVEVVKRIPNIKKLRIHYVGSLGALDGGKVDILKYLQHLDKLESLSIYFLQASSCSKEAHLSENLTFPQSLKKLVLKNSRLPWESMTIIGSMPNLEVLILRGDAFIGEEWNPIEEQFLSLKYLSIESCEKLKVWNADSIHFPSLEQLSLTSIDNLEEIPLGIGEIPTLRSIKLEFCCDSVVRSVIDILDEQDDNDGIQVEVEVNERNKLGILKARDNLKFTMY